MTAQNANGWNDHGWHRSTGRWPAATADAVRMNVRRIQLDVDKAMARPDLLELAEAISAVPGAEGLNVTVTEIDIQTVGMEVTVEGQYIDVDGLVRAIEKAGAAVHSIDEVVVGDRIVERVPRSR